MSALTGNLPVDIYGQKWRTILLVSVLDHLVKSLFLLIRPPLKSKHRKCQSTVSYAI